MAKEKTIVLAVGHYKKNQGAVHTVTNITEWQINTMLVKAVSDKLSVDGWKVTVIDNLSLPRKVKTINSINPLICIDFHCNAFDEKAAGHEVLYYFGSLEGLLLSMCISSCMKTNQDRSIKAVTTQDGSYFLGNTKPIAALIESFFIDNAEDFHNAFFDMNNLVRDIVAGINIYYAYSTHLRRSTLNI